MQQAERAKRLYDNLDAPTIDELKFWVRSNQGKNVRVSYDDIKLLEKMEKQDIPIVNGKMTKPHPPVVSKEDYIELPEELDVKGWIVDMAVDVMYINDVSFFHSIDRKIKFRALVPLRRRKKKKDHTWQELFEALKIVLRFYNKAEVRIQTIHGDQEFKGKFEEKVFDEFGIKMNLANPNKHGTPLEIMFKPITYTLSKITIFQGVLIVHTLDRCQHSKEGINFLTSAQAGL